MKEKLVYTIKDRCRVCYTCVRECPVKAIKIINGQAEVLQERCIACGNCTRVCSQGAKAYLDSSNSVLDALNSEIPVYALLAPSFVAEFHEVNDPGTLVQMLRILGFEKVFEVAFGADLVAPEYRFLMDKENVNGYISSDCPAIVKYIEKYHPELTGSLVPVVSPVVALTRYLKSKDKSSYKTVFIGPCIAKKDESDEVDYNITFNEIRQMFENKAISFDQEEISAFDPPRAGKGALFPISRGLLETVNPGGEELKQNVIVAEGRIDFQEAIKEYKNGRIDHQHLELLCCEGCIMGPGTSGKGNKFQRRIKIKDYVRNKLQNFNEEDWIKDLNSEESLDLSRSFNHDDQRLPDPSGMEINEVLLSMGKKSEDDHLNCGACGYDTCRNHATAIIKGLAETEMCLPYSIEKLHNSIDDLAISNDKLSSVQQVLKQTEKLAHMGQLSAGIAHELNNPLGVVIMYSNILLEEANEDSEIREDLKLIAEQAERCKAIVGGLLNFARKNQVNYSETNLNELVHKSLASLVIPENVEIVIQSYLKDLFADLDQEQMIQVISNLVKNAIEAMPGGGKITVELSEKENTVFIRICDSGTGIMESDMEKVFEPFFTTKVIGKGTGLGLATAYGVVKMHKGKIDLESNSDPAKGDTFTRFSISLPRRNV